jgi:hypothetical protein
MQQFVTRGPGIQIGGDAAGLVAGGDIHFTHPNDGYIPMEMGRRWTKRTWLPDNWLAAVAGVAGIIGVLADWKWNPISGSPWLTLACTALIVAAVLLLYLRERLNKTGCVPLFSWVIESGVDDHVHISQPIGVCPRCNNTMHLQRFKEKDQPAVYFWECASGVTMHNLLFDPTEFATSPDDDTRR